MSALRAPLAVPVEVRAQVGSGAAAETHRAFRLSATVGEDGVRLFRAAPFEIGRPVDVRFELPAPTRAALALRAEVLPVDDDEDEHEGAAGRELAFIEPPGEARAAISAYVRARLSLPE